ncbi:MAG: recombinase family protein [Phycisphaerales bacterium]|nr:recombinase family protein [Phycisphaerales bacterium]
MARRTSANNSSPTSRAGKVIRCAIYTRKSTEEGLDQEYNTLDAQRDGAVAFIASQKAEGWVCIPDKYDDGGFTGGNIDRPALKRLMADIEQGQIDCVVVYKVDRLSRSLLDFARLMELFERKGVSFVSVTQQFNTTHSMGRLTLNILLSFAQFEREIISERTRDKIAAARRSGRYALGKPILGYDYVPAPPPFTGRKLVPNQTEASLIREMFEMYLRVKSLIRVADACNQRGVRTKAWTTSSGKAVGGRMFDKSIISRILRNPLYIGKVPHHANIYDGEHEAIVSEDLFSRVQAQLKLGATEGGSLVRGSCTALLRGMVRCVACDAAMTATTASRPTAGGKRVYRYYVCSSAGKRGRSTCPCPSLPGQQLERFVIEQFKAVLKQDGIIDSVVGRAVEIIRAAAEERIAERDGIQRQLDDRAATLPSPAQNRGIQRLKAALVAVDRQIAADRERLVDEDELAGAVESFDQVWGMLTVDEQRQIIVSMVESVSYDAATSSVTVLFKDHIEANREIAA